jgi:hypothetical protein
MITNRPTHTLRRTLIASLAVVLAASCDARPLAAQERRESAACSRTVAAVEAGDQTVRALETLLGCPASGPAAIAIVWMRRSPLSPAERTALGRASRWIRDGRIYEAVRAAALNSRRAPDDRLEALQVLTSYFNANYVAGPDYLRGGTIGDPIPATAHAPDSFGDVPLPARYAAEFAGDLAVVAREEADPVVRRAALKLRQAIALEAPHLTPLEKGAIRLRAGCGPRVTLSSSANVTVPIEVRVGDGTGFKRELALVRSVDGTPKSVLLALPRGTVTASVGGRVVARLRWRHAPCAPHETRG